MDESARIAEIYAVANQLAAHSNAMDDARDLDLKVRDAALYWVGCRVANFSMMHKLAIESWMLRMGCDCLNAAEGCLALLDDIRAEEARVEAALKQIDAMFADKNINYGDN